MKEEEIDWKLYHLLPDEEEVPVSRLAELSGFTEETVRSSLARLEKCCMISVMGDSARAVSINEFMALSELKDDPFFCIENGVIKVRK